MHETILNEEGIKKKETKTKKQKYLKLTLNSDLNVGWAIPIDGDCCKRFGPISGGLFNRIGPSGGGGRKLGGAEGGNDVTVASGGIWWCTDNGGREKFDEDIVCDPFDDG